MSIMIGPVSRYRLCMCCCAISAITKTVPKCIIKECTICFNEKQISNTKYYHCTHNNFCRECIKGWRNGGNNCPICRSDSRKGNKYRIK